jgi:hypothetical protein
MKKKIKKLKNIKYQNIDISMFVVAEISVLVRGDHCVGFKVYLNKGD